MAQTLDEFKEKFTEEPKREDLSLLWPHSDDPSDQVRLQNGAQRLGFWRPVRSCPLSCWCDQPGGSPSAVAPQRCHPHHTGLQEWS